MHYLELTREKAEHLNAICQFALEKGVLNVFGISHYQKLNPQFDIVYYNHLIDLAKQYEGVNKLIDLSANAICATHNTKAFLDSGGFLRFLANEVRDDRIQDYTLKTLKQSTIGTKNWTILTIVTIAISVVTTVATNSILERVNNVSKESTKKGSMDSLSMPNKSVSKP